MNKSIELKKFFNVVSVLTDKTFEEVEGDLTDLIDDVIFTSKGDVNSFVLCSKIANYQLSSKKSKALPYGSTQNLISQIVDLHQECLINTDEEKIIMLIELMPHIFNYENADGNDYMVGKINNLKKAYEIMKLG